MNITQQQRQDLTLAVVAGEHQINADCIRLHRDPTQEGSALSQLVDRVVAVIEQSTAQPQAVVPAPSGAGELIAGALFDLMGMLTSQDEVCTFSSRHDAGPAVEQLRKFAENRGLSLEPCDVAGWSKRISAQPSAQAERAPVVQSVPVNCGTGYCSCIECVVEPEAWVYWHPSDTTYDGPDTLHKKAVSRFTDDTRKAMMAKGWLFEPLYPASTVAALKAERDAALARATDWQRLYDRAINEANGLTNYVEDRPELRSAERRLDVIAADARALKGQP